MLLDARLRHHRAELLYICSHVDRLDVFEAKFFLVAPFRKLRDGDEVRPARVLVPDVGGEEFPKAPAGGFGAEKNRWQLVGRRSADQRELAAGGEQIVAGGSHAINI